MTPNERLRLEEANWSTEQWAVWIADRVRRRSGTFTNEP